MSKIYLKRKPNGYSCNGCFFNENEKCTKADKLTAKQYSKEDACYSDIYVVAEGEVVING